MSNQDTIWQDCEIAGSIINRCSVILARQLAWEKEQQYPDTALLEQHLHQLHADKWSLNPNRQDLIDKAMTLYLRESNITLMWQGSFSGLGKYCRVILEGDHDVRVESCRIEEYDWQPENSHWATMALKRCARERFHLI